MKMKLKEKDAENAAYKVIRRLQPNENLSIWTVWLRHRLFLKAGMESLVGVRTLYGFFNQDCRPYLPTVGKIYVFVMGRVVPSKAKEERINTKKPSSTCRESNL